MRTFHQPDQPRWIAEPLVMAADQGQRGLTGNLVATFRQLKHPLRRQPFHRQRRFHRTFAQAQQLFDGEGARFTVFAVGQPIQQGRLVPGAHFLPRDSDRQPAQIGARVIEQWPQPAQWIISGGQSGLDIQGARFRVAEADFRMMGFEAGSGEAAYRLRLRRTAGQFPQMINTAAVAAGEVAGLERLQQIAMRKVVQGRIGLPRHRQQPGQPDGAWRNPFRIAEQLQRQRPQRRTHSQPLQPLDIEFLTFQLALPQPAGHSVAQLRIQQCSLHPVRADLAPRIIRQRLQRPLAHDSGATWIVQQLAVVSGGNRDFGFPIEFEHRVERRTAAALRQVTEDALEIGVLNTPLHELQNVLHLVFDGSALSPGRRERHFDKLLRSNVLRLETLPQLDLGERGAGRGVEQRENRRQPQGGGRALFQQRHREGLRILHPFLHQLDQFSDGQIGGVGASVVHGVAAGRAVAAVQQAQHHVVQAELLQLRLMELRLVAQQLEDEGVHNIQRLGPKPGQPGRFDIAQGVLEILFQAANGEFADLWVAGILQQPQQRRGTDFPGVIKSAAVQRLRQVAAPQMTLVGGPDQILMPPNLVGDPAMAEVSPRRVMAQHLTGVHRKQFGQVLAQSAQITPGAAAQVQPGATGDFSAAGRRLHVQAVTQHAQHGQIVTLFRLFINTLDALPDAPAHGVRGQLRDQFQQQRARWFIIGGVQIQQHLAQAQAWRRVGRGQQRGPTAKTQRLQLIGGFTG